MPALLRTSWLLTAQLLPAMQGVECAGEHAGRAGPCRPAPSRIRKAAAESAAMPPPTKYALATLGSSLVRVAPARAAGATPTTFAASRVHGRGRKSRDRADSSAPEGGPRPT